MKPALFVLTALLTSLSAFAEGPILNCTATREGPRSDGKPGYEKIDEKTFPTVIRPRMTVTELKGLTVKTYVDANGASGHYALVLIDNELGVSSTSMGTLDNKRINLSLSSRKISNFISCELQ